MWKLGFIFGVILLICSGSNSERYIGNATHKDYPGMCFHKETQTPIAIGKTFRPTTTECVEIYCRDDYVLRLDYCPVYMLNKGCTETINKGAEYPECCAKITCL